MEAQTTTIAGEYYLRGVMETASGFNLAEDHSFEFFFSYGALDRVGKGTWELKDDKVIFNSPKAKEQGFILTTNKVVDNDKITIRIVEPNAFFSSHVYAIVKSGDKQLEALSDKEGFISFPKQPIDSIILLFEFAAEKAAVFTITNKEENFFEFKFDPSILDVVFENLSLKLDEHGLSGQHPLLIEGVYHFEKN
ncbi:MAG: hypothetical protein QM737_10655 [Ferruginibacter sp.]